jgi:hypothetical protein
MDAAVVAPGWARPGLGGCVPHQLEDGNHPLRQVHAIGGVGGRPAGEELEDDDAGPPLPYTAAEQEATEGQQNEVGIEVHGDGTATARGLRPDSGASLFPAASPQTPTGDSSSPWNLALPRPPLTPPWGEVRGPCGRARRRASWSPAYPLLLRRWCSPPHPHLRPQAAPAADWRSPCCLARSSAAPSCLELPSHHPSERAASRGMGPSHRPRRRASLPASSRSWRSCAVVLEPVVGQARERPLSSPPWRAAAGHRRISGPSSPSLVDGR